jgi:hypothetical protein
VTREKAWYYAVHLRSSLQWQACSDLTYERCELMLYRKTLLSSHVCHRYNNSRSMLTTARTMNWSFAILRRHNSSSRLGQTLIVLLRS